MERPIFSGGKKIGSVRTYSDQAALFILKARRPEVYDRVAGQAAGPGDMTEAEAKADYERRLARVLARSQQP